MHERKSGILLHITSLPSRFGIGDLGPEAYRFADFLCDAGQKLWQILPLSPIIVGKGNSPYHSTSAFAANPLLISPELLVKDGLLDKADIRAVPVFPEERVDYEAAAGYKNGLLEKACARFRSVGVFTEFNRFCDENAKWLDDYSLFTALKKKHEGLPWWKWPPKLRDRRPEAPASALSGLEKAVFLEKFIQWIFSKQWFDFKEYCNQRGIRIFGDLPIYVQQDSVDVWTHPGLFYLDDRKKPTVVAGVPPDYFSETGQLWGNPIYRWDVLRENGYGWWFDRIGHSLKWFDLIRIDHFRGFVGYWEGPGRGKNGHERQMGRRPGGGFFRKAQGMVSGPAHRRGGPGRDHSGCARGHGALRPAGHEGAAVRLRREPPDQRVRSAQPYPELPGLFRHPRQQHRPRVVRWGSDAGG